jgi:hypothetical protein
LIERRPPERPPERGVRRVFGTGTSIETRGTRRRDAKDSRGAGSAGRGELDDNGYDPRWILDLIRGADASSGPVSARDYRMQHESESESDDREGSFFVRFFTRITHFRWIARPRDNID